MSTQELQQERAKLRRCLALLLGGVSIAVAIYGFDKARRATNAEAILNGRVAVLSLLMQSEDINFVIVDANDCVEDWSLGAEKLFGYTKAEVLGKDISFLMPEDKIATHKSGYAAALKGEYVGKKHIILRCMVKHKNHDLIPVRITTRMYDLGGRKLATAAFDTEDSVKFIDARTPEEKSWQRGQAKAQAD